MGKLSISHQSPFLNIGPGAPTTNVPRSTWSTQVGEIKGVVLARLEGAPGELQGPQPEGKMVGDTE